MKKLPTIDTTYWALIICATTMGETAGDLVSMTLKLGYAVGSILLVGAFVAALVASLWSKRQQPLLYWTVVILASTAGTTMSDFVTRSLHLGYLGGVLLLAGLLAAVFGVWRALSPSVAVTGALSRDTEFLYWAAILVSSTLGTAFGDLIANGTRLGFVGGTVLLGALLVGVALLARFTRVSRDLCYWLAIVITHPIGATAGDSLVKEDGLNLGPVVASTILIAAFAAVVGVGALLQRRQATTPAA